jgi:hypothetical protein
VTGFRVADVETAGIDLSQRTERSIRFRLGGRELRRLGCIGLGLGCSNQAELGGSQSYGTSRKNAAIDLRKFPVRSSAVSLLGAYDRLQSRDRGRAQRGLF